MWIMDGYTWMDRVYLDKAIMGEYSLSWYFSYWCSMKGCLVSESNMMLLYQAHIDLFYLWGPTIWWITYFLCWVEETLFSICFLLFSWRYIRVISTLKCCITKKILYIYSISIICVLLIVCILVLAQTFVFNCYFIVYLFFNPR